WAQDWGTVGAIDLSIVDGQLNANVTAVSEQFWSVQLFQEGIAVANGNVYTITFEAKADVARDFSVVFIDGNGVEFRKTFNLTTEMQTFTFTFLYTGTASTGKLDYEFGNISVDSVPALITMDNVYFFRNFNPYVPE
ncbi:carbohydrate binding domain-containing protein, partial [Candidatus Woesearchaeota archaeon]|nr:carbohydrate binding domain-containing protein [Candidatus Woesearchaeota archaeon]